MTRTQPPLDTLDPLSPTPKRDLAILTDLYESPGWELFLGILHENYIEAADQLSDPTINGLKATIDFQRGMLYCIKQVPTVLTSRIKRLEADTIMSDLSQQDPQTH